MVAPSYSIAPDHGQRNRLAGIASATEAARGWDQGFCVPLKVMVPGAEIPLVPISLGNGLDPAAYLAIRWAPSGKPGTVHFHGHALGKPISGFRFG